MRFKGILYILDNKTEEINIVPIRQDIKVNNWEEAAEFMHQVQETNNSNKVAKENIIGYLYTLIKDDD